MEDKYNLKVGVKVLLVSPENNILFLKRSSEVYKDKDYLLDIPGGRIKEDFNLFDNLEREVFEETGQKIMKNPIILSAQEIWHDNDHIVRLTYISRVTDETVVLSEEHSSFEWIPLEKLPSRVSEVDEFIAEIIKDKMSFIKDILNK